MQVYAKLLRMLTQNFCRTVQNFCMKNQTFWEQNAVFLGGNAELLVDNVVVDVLSLTRKAQSAKKLMK